MLSPVKDVCDMLTAMSVNLVRGGSALQDLMEEVRPATLGTIVMLPLEACLFTEIETGLRVGHPQASGSSQDLLDLLRHSTLLLLANCKLFSSGPDHQLTKHA